MDCDNFYATCEKLFRPDLENKPVVVLSNNDGCIIARSKEAKALKIPMGEPLFKHRQFLKEHNVEVFSSNYALYADISQRVMEVAESVLPHVEQYSIDEAFLHFTNAGFNNAEEIAWNIRNKVKKNTGVSVCLGLAPTRTLAKIANKIAKKNTGVYLFPNDEIEQDKILENTLVEDIWGIGNKSAEKLIHSNVFTAKDLKYKDSDWIRKKISVTGLNTALELRGIACIEDDNGKIRQSLVSSRSFGEKIYEKKYLAEALTAYTTNAGERLRKEKLLTKNIAVLVRSSNFTEEHYSKTINIQFQEATNDTKILINAMLQGLDIIFKEGIAYAKAGVSLIELSHEDSFQPSLLRELDPSFVEKSKASSALMATLDSINVRYGRNTLHYAKEGLEKSKESIEKKADKNAPWRMKQSYKSPKYTTSWNELAKAKCN